ncbi:MAG: N-formylglutamate amidohydrolase [bacterium]
MSGRSDRLNIAFESERLSYSDQEVDLYNSGINQILSVAAARRHSICHFSMGDLFLHEEEPYARASILSLPEGWEGDPLESYLDLKKEDERPVPLSDLDLCFARGDDIRHTGTPNLELLRSLDKSAVLMESIEATLSTCDKYELVRRLPDIPMPVTFAASTIEDALEAVRSLPQESGFFVLKDRYGYGCGDQVHLLEFADPELEALVAMYLSIYNYILVQEYCPEVKDGDLVVTFFDGELLAPLHRMAGWGEWKTNFCKGGSQRYFTLNSEQESIARTVMSAFPDCRFASVDMLLSGKVMEINAFPGGRGLLEIYGISVGNIIMDRMEKEILGKPLRPSPSYDYAFSPHVGARGDIKKLYESFEPSVPVFDVFTNERHDISIKSLIGFWPRSADFVLSIPHSGVLVPVRYADQLDISNQCLLEIDMYSDILYGGLEGMQVICGLAPFFLDLNREREGSEEPGLPCHLTNPATEYYSIENKSLLKRPYSRDQKEHILEYYDLYHGILERLIRAMKEYKGYALLLDGHTMSSVGLGRVHDEGRERKDFVVGTLNDTSAHPEIINAFVESLKAGADSHQLGLTFEKNQPYSGGFITRNYADPEQDVHVIQLEVTMDTYMYEPVEESRLKRYGLKQLRVRIVQDILRHALQAAIHTAERIYSGPRQEAP